MPSWLKGLMISVAAKFGGAYGWILVKILDYGGEALWNYVQGVIARQKQKEAEKKVQEDIDQKKQRTDEVRKNEKDFLNS